MYATEAAIGQLMAQPRYISMRGQATAMLNHVVMSRTGNAVAKRTGVTRMQLTLGQMTTAC